MTRELRAKRNSRFCDKGKRRKGEDMGNSTRKFLIAATLTLAVAAPTYAKGTKTVTLAVGGTAKLKTKGMSGKKKWKSADATIAKVNGSGKTRGVSPGTTTVTATKGGKKREFKIVVKAMGLPATAYVQAGSKTTLAVTGAPKKTKIKWKSSKKKVATASKGVVRAKKPGTTTVSATCCGRTFTCKVVVYEKGKKPKEAEKRKPANVKGKITIGLRRSFVFPGSGLKWTSSDPSVVTINPSTGRAVASSQGTSTVTGTGTAGTYEWAVTVIDGGFYPAAENLDPPSESQARAIIETFRTKYPTGMAFDNSVRYWWNGGIYGEGGGCAAFGFEISDAIFGERRAIKLLGSDVPLFEIARPGDLIRLYGDTHLAVVVAKTDWYLQLAEAGYGGKVLWDRQLSEVEANKGDWLLTRY